MTVDKWRLVGELLELACVVIRKSDRDLEASVFLGELAGLAAEAQKRGVTLPD